ncbi:GIY-YIG nuclease family protein [Anaerosinus massiliensis]|uniref:GIY-YIG nuclease family protein n=1 Tax=Massilibacillus massiliensis TaxID=1806837 RepID=UPI000DA62A02|nr:GIY-YIG nuclease family protein [Massilibacillus massiliensis]
MADNGYIYVLINASMEGLIKVGKTTREPKERAEELSRATGVPTPFIVAYEMYVNDCTSAENFVHTWLETKEYRVSDNREFFNAPMTEAINGIMEYKKNEKSNMCIPDDDFLNPLIVEEKAPWEDVLEIADKYYYGLGDTLQDYYQAYNLYKKAAKLGSGEAYLKIGGMHRYGNGCNKDIKLALDYLNQAINYGCHIAYGEMMSIYFFNEQFENAYKCWDKYIDYIQNDPSSALICQDYITLSYKNNLPIKHINSMLTIQDEIIQEQTEFISNIKDNINLRFEMSNVLKYMEYIFSFESDEEIMLGQDYIRKSVRESNAEYMKEKNASELSKLILGAVAIIALYIFLK